MQFSLKKLLQGGFIEIFNQETSGRKKKIYVITESGKALFYDWMLHSEIRPEHIDSNVLPKVYFLGLISSNKDKRAIISNIINAYTKQEENLKYIEHKLSQIDIESSVQPIFNFHVATLNYGIAMQNNAKQWYIDLLDTIPDTD